MRGAGVRESAAEPVGNMGESAAALPSLIQAVQNGEWPKARAASLQSLGTRSYGIS